MNKTLSVVALCLGSAAIGGFIAVRLVEHPQAVQVAPKPTSPISATPVLVPAKISSVAGGPSEQTDNALAAIPSTQKPMKAQDDYDFDSVAGSNENLEKRFDSERRDPGWAPHAIDTASYELEGLPVYRQLTSVNVDCRATLCRIEGTMSLEALQATQTSGTGWAEAMSGLMTAPPWSTEFDNSSIVVSIDEHLGQAQLTTYLHRRPQGVVGYARNAS